MQTFNLRLFVFCIIFNIRSIRINSSGYARSSVATVYSRYIIMKVVFLKNVTGVGQVGQIKEVKDGFAMNYLLPRGLASNLTKHNLTMIEAQSKKKERIKSEQEKDKIKLAKKLNGQVFEIKVKADETGSLYDKINKEDLIKYLLDRGYAIGEKEIVLENIIKKIGEYKIKLILAGETVEFKLVINKE